MGMYNGLAGKIYLKDNTPKHIWEILFRLKNEYYPELSEDHPFFKSGHYGSIFLKSTGDEYFDDIDVCIGEYNNDIDIDDASLSMGCSFKIDDTIELFLDWLTPYIDCVDELSMGVEGYNGLYRQDISFVNGEIKFSESHYEYDPNERYEGMCGYFSE